MKRSCLFPLVALSALFLFSCADGDGNESAPDYSAVVANTDEKVIECFNLTNEFRTGSEAFYLNEDNATTTSLVGKLGTLELDAELCRAAQIRANEIVKSFSHTRPNGKSCFTVLSDLSISYSAAGENIAAGSSTGRGTFTQWKEDDENYAGQGHRRNMLGQNFTKIGIAYAYAEGSRYRYYWAMILAK